MKVSAGGTALGTADFGRAVYRLLGLPIDAADMAEALDRIRTAAAARRPCFVSTPNLNFLIACQKDAAFRESVIRSDLRSTFYYERKWIALGRSISRKLQPRGTA